MLMLVAYLVTYPIGFKNGLICFVSLILGVVRKAGYPQLSMEYAQRAIFTEDFQNLTYYMSVSMAPNTLFINLPLIINALANLCVDFKRMLDKNPNA